MQTTKEVVNNTPAQIAIGNLKSTFESVFIECSLVVSKQKLSPESEEALVTSFDALYDEHISFELNGKRYRYDWLLYSARQNWSKKTTFQNLDTEILDKVTFHYTFDCYLYNEDDCILSQPLSKYKMHFIATVNPKNSKVIKIKVMTGEAAMYVFHSNMMTTTDAIIKLDNNNNNIDVNNNVEMKQTATNTKSTATPLPLLVNNDQSAVSSSTTITSSSPKPSSSCFNPKKGHRRIASYTHDGGHHHRNNKDNHHHNHHHQEHNKNHHRTCSSFHDRLHSRISRLTTGNNSNE